MVFAIISYALFIIFFGYFIILMSYYFALFIIGLSEGNRRMREAEVEDYGSFAASHFTIPVSIILPAHNEQDWILDSLKSILNQNYPEFEVIVVNDGSTDSTMQILEDFLKLKPVDRVYQDRFQSGKIHVTLGSELYRNVSVLTKSDGYKKAGAVNAGLNFARYKYVCVMDSDTVLEPDALLKTMAHVEKDPEHIIGIGSYFGLVNGFKIQDGKIIDRSFSLNPLIAYQNLEYIRSFIGNRIAWSRFNSTPIISGGFGIWRRDILLELGGYAPDFSSEDIELTFRAQDYIVKNNKEGYKIIMLPYYVGWTEGPSGIKSLIIQRNRWQRVINETVIGYRHMIFNPKYKSLGFLVLPYYLLYEVLGAFVETISIGIVAVSAIAGVVDLKTFLGFLILMIFCQTIISLLCLFSFIRNQRIFKLKYIAYLVGLSFIEFPMFRWIQWIAKIAGTIGYFRGVRKYDMYTREPRAKLQK